MRKYVIIILLLLFVTCYYQLKAQQHEIVFQQCYGGNGSDGAFTLTKNNQGVFFFGGTSSNDGDVSFNHGGLDYWLVQTDTLGSIIWERTYGGSDSEWPKNMLNTSDNGYLLFGITFSDNGDVSGLHGGGDFWLVRTDSLGNLLWQKCLGGSCNDTPLQLIKAHGGGYICIGSTCSTDGDIAYNHGVWDAWVVRLSETGEIIWEKTYGGGGRIMVAQ